MTDQQHTTNPMAEITRQDLEFFVGILGRKLKPKGRRSCLEQARAYAGPRWSGTNIHPLRPRAGAEQRVAAMDVLIQILEGTK